MLLRYGNTLAPAGSISSVEMLFPTFNITSSSIESGRVSNRGKDWMFGPLINFILRPSSRGGTNNVVLMAIFSGSVYFGYGIPSVRGSVMTPVIAEAVTVSGLHK